MESTSHLHWYRDRSLSTFKEEILLALAGLDGAGGPTGATAADCREQQALEGADSVFDFAAQGEETHVALYFGYS